MFLLDGSRRYYFQIYTHLSKTKIDNGNTLGIIDEEFYLSLRTLSHIANKNDCNFQIEQIRKGERGKIAQIKIK